jgi:hypothetical protein
MVKQEVAAHATREDGATVVVEAPKAGDSWKTEDGGVDEEGERLVSMHIANPDHLPNPPETVVEKVGEERGAVAAVVAAATEVSAETRTFHTVAAAAAAAFSEAGYAPKDDLKLHMRMHVPMHATEDRSGFAEALQTFGAACAERSTVGIAVVSTTEGAAQAWLFEAEGGDDSALRAVLAEDAPPPPSLLLRQVNLAEDYLASHAHGSAIGIDPSEGVSGLRLPDGEEVPRLPLTEGS